MREKPRILVIDDQAGMRRSLAILLRKEEYEVVEAKNGQHAISFIAESPFDLVITDLKMSPGTGLDVLFFVRERHPVTQVIVMTGYGTVQSAVIAMRMGAFDYLSKPFKNEEILHRVSKAIRYLETQKAIDDLGRDNGSSASDSPVVGVSPAVLGLRDLIAKMARVDLPVLITGETGTGKNLVARTIHSSGSRSDRSFVSVNCAGVPDSLLQSELFGHVKGAFTGAFIERKGLFQEADGGTLLLDEIGSMPVTMQAKLLDFLQDQSVRPVGSNKQLQIDTRVIAATNKDLMQALSDGEFREDLYYRIRVARIHIPPLRERPEDIPELIQHALHKLRRDFNRPHLDITSEAAEFLRNYDFPGNIRELLNAVSSAATISPEETIGLDDIAMSLTNRMFEIQTEGKQSDPSTLEEWESTLIRKSIEKHTHNLTSVCKELGIPRTTLWRKMGKYGIQ